MYVHLVDFFGIKRLTWGPTDKYRKSFGLVAHFRTLCGGCKPSSLAPAQHKSAYEILVEQSNSLRSAYIDQIRNADLVPKSLMNFVPPSLKLAYPSNNPVGSERYKVDQFYVECMSNKISRSTFG